MLNLNPKRKKETLTLIVVFLGVLLISAFAVYFLANRSARPEVERQTAQRSDAEPSSGTTPPLRRDSPPAERSGNIFGQVFSEPPQSGPDPGGESWGEILARLTLRLLLAALLGAVLAYRPRRRVLNLKRNPYVGQTQILLAVVASALMIIVGDNAARAFGIFAAVSVVRFRTNIRDPKEITVLLISLAIGLGTGVGRWDLSLVLTIFSLILLWILEYREADQVFRAMELKVLTRNVNNSQAILREVFKAHGFDSELRMISQGGGDEAGTLSYSVDISPTVTTDQLSEEILARDSQNLESIEWDQKKTFSYMYQ